MDILTQLKIEHDEVSELFKSLEKTTTWSHKTRRELFHELDPKLSAHAERQARLATRIPLITLLRSETGSAVPYVVGWFLGVPASVLFLIFLVRSC